MQEIIDMVGGEAAQKIDDMCTSTTNKIMSLLQKEEKLWRDVLTDPIHRIAALSTAVKMVDHTLEKRRLSDD